jgi:hypothetical protein
MRLPWLLCIHFFGLNDLSIFLMVGRWVQCIPQEQFGLGPSTSDGENKLYASDGLVGRAVGDVRPPMRMAGV